MTNEDSIKILNFITPGAGGGILCQGVADTFKNFFSTLEDGSDKPKKTVLMMCLLIPITKTAHIAVFLCIGDFYLFMMGLLI